MSHNLGKIPFKENKVNWRILFIRIPLLPIGIILLIKFILTLTEKYNGQPIEEIAMWLLYSLDATKLLFCTAIMCILVRNELLKKAELELNIEHQANAYRTASKLLIWSTFIWGLFIVVLFFKIKGVDFCENEYINYKNTYGAFILVSIFISFVIVEQIKIIQDKHILVARFLY